MLNEDALQQAAVAADDEAELHDYFARFGTGAANAEEHVMLQAPVRFTMAQVRSIAASVKLV